MATFVHRSQIAASREAVWDFVTTPEGVNHELMPLMRMTVPREFRGRTVADVEPGGSLGRSWLMLAGFLPFDFTNITVAEIDPGERFLERSTLGSMRHWQHERSLEIIDAGTTMVTDSIEYEMRLPIPGLSRLTMAVLSRLFPHRHRRLASHFES